MRDRPPQDRTARRLFLAGVLLLLLTLVFGIVTLLRRNPAGSATIPGTRPAVTAVAAIPATAAEMTQILAPTSAPTRPPARPATPTVPRAAPTAVAPTPYLTPLRRPLVYAALGAGDTLGLGTANPAGEAWPILLAGRLGADVHAAAFARDSLLLSGALGREIDVVIAARPALVTVSFGPDDLRQGVPLATFQQQLATLLGRLTAETAAQVVLLNLPDVALILPAGVLPGTPEDWRRQVQTWNVAIGATAAPYGARVLVVDLFAQSDGVLADAHLGIAVPWHPGTTGSRTIATVVYAQMAQAGLVPLR